jgi:rhodanese-related sulfurtransferase
MFMSSIKEIDAPELASWVKEKHPNMRVIDVRGMHEIAHGTVEGAEAVPLHTLPVKFNEFNREEKLVFICRSGARSAQACMFLQQQGYDNVYNLRGGMMGWMQCGLEAADLA